MAFAGSSMSSSTRLSPQQDITPNNTTVNCCQHADLACPGPCITVESIAAIIDFHKTSKRVPAHWTSSDATESSSCYARASGLRHRSQHKLAGVCYQVLHVLMGNGLAVSPKTSIISVPILPVMVCQASESRRHSRTLLGGKLLPP